MRQTRLAINPISVEVISVANQDALPILDQLLKWLLGARRIDAIEVDLIVDHGP